MNLWILALYLVAAFVSLKSLTQLMTDHKRQYMDFVVERERQRARAEEAKLAAEAAAEAAEQRAVA